MWSPRTGNPPLQEKICRKGINLMTIDVPHSVVGTLIKLRVPAERQEMRGRKGLISASYVDLIDQYMIFRREAQPWLDDTISVKAGMVDLEATKTAFPNIPNKNTALCIAAYFAYICIADDAIDTLPLPEARQCAADCLAILKGTRFQGVIFDTVSNRTKQVASSYRDAVIRYLPPAAAEDVLRETYSVVEGELAEREALDRGAPFPDFQAYLRLRESAIALQPIFAMLEHLCLPGGVPPLIRSDVDAIRKNANYAGIIQNDSGGIGLDIESGNPSNSFLILAKISGRPICKQKDLKDRDDIREEAEALHDVYVQNAIDAFTNLLQSDIPPGARDFGWIMMDFCRGHPIWTITSSRYRTTCY